MTTRALFLLSFLTCASCQGVERTQLRRELRLASGFVDRGVLQYDAVALQAAVTGQAEHANGSVVTGSVWAHLNVEDDAGDGVFEDGSGGELGRWDLRLAWARPFGPGELELAAVRIDSPDRAAPLDESTELRAAYGFDGCPLHPRLAVAWEVEDVDDLHVWAETHHPVAVEERWSVDLWGRVGWFGDGYADAYFGERASGFSDVAFGPRLRSRLSDQVALVADLLMHRAVEEAYRKALRDADVAPDRLVLSAGIEWTL